MVDIQSEMAGYVRSEIERARERLNEEQPSYAMRNFLAGYLEALKGVNTLYDRLVDQHIKEICEFGKLHPNTEVNSNEKK